MQKEFTRVLLTLSFPETKAKRCASIFAGNSRDGVYSHGLNRFPVFVQLVRDGLIDPASEPEVINTNGTIEHWDGQCGAGMYNASAAMTRAIELAKEHGLGLVTLRNTNHWMRGGTYGWLAADAGCIGICTTNTIANMPPWGGKEPRLGNNPLVIAVPHEKGNIVLDMALSQYSYGALQEYEFKKQQLPVPGGYDEKGNLSQDPSVIRASQRALPIGFWKGSGLSLLLDVVLTALSGGDSVSRISARKKETGITQLFLCIYQQQLHDGLVREIIEYTKSSAPAEGGQSIAYPGEHTLRTREDNLRNGIPVQEDIWKQVLAM